MILLLDNYDSFTFNLYQYVLELGFSCEVRRNNRISLTEIDNLAPSHILISPGPGRPNEAGITLHAIKKFAGRIPILGICLGHQSIGEAFGAKVVKAALPVHGKVSEIFHRSTQSYKTMPQPFPATRYHSLVIERHSLPNCFEITAETVDGTIMGIRHQTMPLEGIQFHPESIMTPDGKKLLRQALEVGL